MLVIAKRQVSFTSPQSIYLSITHPKKIFIDGEQLSGRDLLKLKREQKNWSSFSDAIS
jgi:hypothetical protein